jgi:hypothetical protein
MEEVKKLLAEAWRVANESGFDMKVVDFQIVETMGQPATLIDIEITGKLPQ